MAITRFRSRANGQKSDRRFYRKDNGQSAACRFNWASPLTEIVLLGNIAIRTGKRIEWDEENMQITNDRDANKYIKEPYHNDWSLEV